MAEQQTLAQKIRAKYGNDYDDLTDEELETKWITKYPDDYNDIPRTQTKQVTSPEPISPPLSATIIEPGAVDLPTLPQGVTIEDPREPELFTEEEPGMLENLYQQAVEPMANLRGQPDVYEATEQFAQENPYIGKPINFGLDILSGLSSPLDVATGSAFTGAGVARKLGLESVANLAGKTGRALSAPVFAHGTSTALGEGTPAEKATGIFEMLGGFAGIRSGIGKPGSFDLSKYSRKYKGDKVKELISPTMEAEFTSDIKTPVEKPVSLGAVTSNDVIKAKQIIKEYGETPKSRLGREIVEQAEAIKPNSFPQLTKGVQIKPKVKMRLAEDGTLKPDMNDPVTASQVKANGKISPDTEVSVPEPLEKIDIKRTPLQELANLPRAIQSSYDISFPFRQGLGLIHTKGWWKAWPDMIRSYGSDAAYRGTIDSILQHPNYRRIKDAKTGKMRPSFAEEAGLELTDLVSKREEAFMSTIAEKVPGVKASNRAYVAFANKLRADNFNAMIDMAEKSGLKPKQDLVLAKEIAGFINNASGRGDIKLLEKHASTLNGLLFSPKLMSSRLQMLNPRNYIMAPPMVRKQYLHSTLAMTTAWTTMASMAQMAGAEVSFDPNSSDFGKIKIGDTRLDPGAGFLQYLVLAHRLSSGEYTTSTGKTREFGKGFGSKSRLGALGDFFMNKFAPIPRYATRALGAEEYKPFAVGDEALRMFIPMILQDISEIAQSDPELLPLTIPTSAVGIGIQNYGSRRNNPRLLGPLWPEENDIVLPR